jgi:hypothetical protein
MAQKNGRWFRVYDDLVNDPKVQRLEPALFKFLINIWCLASQNGGVIPPVDQLQFALREPDASLVVASLEALVHHGLADRSSNQHGSWLAPHAWTKRQYKSDTSTERVKRFRAVPKTVTGNGSETPPDTESDTDTESEVENSKKEPTEGGFSTESLERAEPAGKNGAEAPGSFSERDAVSEDGQVIIKAAEIADLEKTWTNVKNLKGQIRNSLRLTAGKPPDYRKRAVYVWLGDQDQKAAERLIIAREKMEKQKTSPAKERQAYKGQAVRP